MPPLLPQASAFVVNHHAEYENIRIGNLFEGIKTMRTLMMMK
jgi:hypothetical protein